MSFTYIQQCAHIVRRRTAGNPLECPTVDTCACVSPFTTLRTDLRLSCICEGSEQYLDAETSTCNPWTSCMPGTYVSKPGSTSTDRTCNTCSNGTYSDVENTAVCKPWSSCATVAEAGTTTSNRICKATSTTASSRSFAGALAGVGGLLALCVIVFVVRKRQSKQRHHTLFSVASRTISENQGFAGVEAARIPASFDYSKSSPQTLLEEAGGRSDRGAEIIESRERQATSAGDRPGPATTVLPGMYVHVTPEPQALSPRSKQHGSSSDNSDYAPLHSDHQVYAAGPDGGQQQRHDLHRTSDNSAYTHLEMDHKIYRASLCS